MIITSKPNISRTIKFRTAGTFLEESNACRVLVTKREGKRPRHWWEGHKERIKM